MPKKATLILAVVLLAIGAALRYHYFYLEQYALKLLIAISILIFACAVLIRMLRTRSLTYWDSLAYAVVVVILCGLTFESAAGNKRKNQKYLEKLAGIINRYSEKHDRLPDSVEEALAVWEILPNRGDADGNGFQYIRLGNRIFVMRSFGSNQKNDFGAADDVQLNYLNRTSVTFEQLSNWVRSEGTADEKELLALYFPALQRD